MPPPNQLNVIVSEQNRGLQNCNIGSLSSRFIAALVANNHTCLSA